MGRLLSALAVVGIVAYPSVVRADEAGGSTRYTVVAGDTCAAIATRHYGDPRLVDLIHSANLGMGPPPHALKAGAVLILPPKPVATPSAPDARLTWFRNHVEVRAPEPRPAKANDPLFRGDRVGTKESSNADVTFRDETQVRLSENTLIVILGDVNAKATKLTADETTLVTGALRSRMAELAGGAAEKKIATGSGSIALKSGTEAQISVDAKNTTRLAVYKGTSTLTAQKKSVDVANGFGSKADQGRAPTPPRPLPLAPAVRSRLGDATVTTAAEATDVTFELTPSPGSTASAPPPVQWHLQLARDAAFNDVLVDVQVPEAVRTIETKNATAGTYFARASAIDADAFEGKWSNLSSVGLIVVGLAPAERGARETRIASVSPDGATCTPALIDRRRATSLSCSMVVADPSRSDAAKSVGSMALEALPIRATHAMVTMATRDGGGGRAVVRLLDEANQPVAEAFALTATLKNAAIARLVRVTPVRERPGEYELGFVAIDNAGGATAMDLHLDDGVGGHRDVPTSNPLMFEPLKIAGPRTSIDVDVAGRISAIQATQSGAMGIGADGLVALPSSTPKRWWLGELGLSADRILVAKGDLTTGRDIARARGTVFGAHAFIGARYRATSLLTPYVLAGPEIVTTDTRVRQSGVRADGSSVALGVGGGLGLELRTTSRSAVFVELGGRWLADLTTEGSVINTSGGTLTIGHRFTLRPESGVP